MGKDKQPKPRNCPVLLIKGKELGMPIDEGEAGYGVEQNWIKEVCTNCKLEICFYDKEEE